jgi:hypothetical protein
MYEELRTMTQITGPAASRLLGDVEKRLRTTAAGYDRNLVRLLQMGVAIAGWRVQTGAWPKDSRRDKFLPFNLKSYDEDKLEIAILPRELVETTADERYKLLIMKKTALPSIPEAVLAAEGGYAPEIYESWKTSEPTIRKPMMEELTGASQPTGPNSNPGGNPGDRRPTPANE